MEFLALHLAEQAAGLVRLRNEVRRTHDAGERDVGLASMERPQCILRVQHALDAIEVAAMDRHAREAVREEGIERGGQRVGDLHGDDVRTRHHDLANDRIAELEDRVDHAPLGILDAAFLMSDLRHRADFLFRNERPLLQALARQEDVRDGDQ